MSRVLLPFNVGFFVRGGLSVYLFLTGTVDTGRLPTVALTQAAGILAVGLALRDGKVGHGIAVGIGCLFVATLAHVLSMPGMTMFDASIAQASELLLPMVAMLAVMRIQSRATAANAASDLE